MHFRCIIPSRMLAALTVACAFVCVRSADIGLLDRPALTGGGYRSQHLHPPGASAGAGGGSQMYRTTAAGQSHQLRQLHVTAAATAASDGSAGGHRHHQLPDHWRHLADDRYLSAVNATRLAALAVLSSLRVELRVSVVNDSLSVQQDGSTIYSVPESSSGGIHVIGIAAPTGSVMPGDTVTLSRHFKTGEMGEGDLLASCLMDLSPGTLIVVVAVFNAGDKLGRTERFLLEKLGMEGLGVGGGTTARHLTNNASQLEHLNYLSNLRNKMKVTREQMFHTYRNFESKHINNNNNTKRSPVELSILGSPRKKLQKSIKNNIYFENSMTNFTTSLSSNFTRHRNNEKQLTISTSSRSIEPTPAVAKQRPASSRPLRGGYIESDDPVVLITRVPQGWPPCTEQANFQHAVVAEVAIVPNRRGRPVINMDVEVSIPKWKGSSCPWHQDPSRAQQMEFCTRYSGYGALCRCADPISPADTRVAAEPIPMNETIPVTMLTAKKSHFFYRQLMSLLQCGGAGQTPIMVLLDGPHRETQALAALFGLQCIIHNHEGADGTPTPLNAHFRFSIYTAFSSYRGVDKVIILEDDLLLSPDFISFFHQSAWLLDVDDSIYCINSFSVNSCAGIAVDPTRLRRSEVFPQFGWMVTRRWAEEVIPMWVLNSEADIDWDWWLHTESVRHGRHVLVPEVSRTLHSGAAGAHVTGWMQALIFSNMVYNQDKRVKLNNLERLQEREYAEYIRQELTSASVLPITFNPCYMHTLPDNLPAGPLLLIVECAHNNPDEGKALETVARCLHAFPQDTRDHYQGVVQYALPNADRRLYVLACPMSPYCLHFQKLPLMLPPPSEVARVRVADDLWRYRRATRRNNRLRLNDTCGPNNR